MARIRKRAGAVVANLICEALGMLIFISFIGRRASYMTVDMTIFSLNADLGNVASSSILPFHTWPVPKGASYYT